jgi:hypothetical protein
MTETFAAEQVQLRITATEMLGITIPSSVLAIADEVIE